MLDPRGVSLGGLLTDGNPLFEVPDYQRPYSWERGEVTSLLSDLHDAYNSRSGSADAYFLGPMVLVKQPNLQTSDFEVVDGQQRLTTLLVLLATIRDELLGGPGARQGERLHDTYLMRGALNLTQEGDPRLRLRTEDDDYFAMQILAKEGSRPPTPRRNRGRPPKNRLKQAREICEATLRDWLGSLKADKALAFLLEFADFVINKTVIVTIFVTDVGYAHTVFETLNTRGLDLSIQDLVRNLLRQDSSRTVNSAWDQVEKRLSKLEQGGGFRTFIRTSWNSRNPRTTFKELFSALRAFTRQPKGTERLAQAFAEDSTHFVEIVAPSKPSPTTPVLESLEAMGLRQHLPMLLAAIARLDERDFQEIVGLVELITVRYLLVAENNPNRLEEYYVNSAHRIRSEGKNALREIRAQARNLVASESEEFASGFSKLVCTSATARYLLMKLELAGNTEFSIASAMDVNVEHILPKQAEDRSWTKAFPDPDDFTNRLGNLTLLASHLNKGASNRSFKTKRDDYYKQSKIGLTRELGGLGSWTPEALETRQARLAERAERVWPIPEAE